MEHCTGASKEIKFNITYRDKLLHENITRTVLQKRTATRTTRRKNSKPRLPHGKWAVGVIIIIRGIAEFAGPTGISGLQ